MYDEFEQPPTARNSSGSMLTSAKMMHSLRYGETNEPSDFIREIISTQNMQAKRFMFLMTNFDEWYSPVIDTKVISTAVEVLGDNYYNIEIGFVIDEMCRMIQENRDTVLTVREILDEVVTDEKGNVLNHPLRGKPARRKNVYLWSCQGDHTMDGVSAAECFSAYNTDPKTGDPLAPEFGLDYVSSTTINFTNLLNK